MFHCATLVLLLVATAFGAEIGNRIIGGSDAADGAYPYQVSLQKNSRHFCGGSILSERWILTAAHCISADDVASPETIQVVVGATILSVGGAATHLGKRAIIHPSWDADFIRNDIALIEISSDIVFNDKVQPIPLPTEDFTKEDYPAILTGWGNDRFPFGRGYDNLQQLPLFIIPQSACLARHSRTDDANICTFTRRGEGACHGDSGGPLVADGVQVGVVSWGTPCGRGQPDVFARVWSFIDWINSYVN